MLRFKRDVPGFDGVVFKECSTIKYKPWPHEWQGMAEPDRVAKGIYVICTGQGEFDVFTADDVDLLDKS